MTLSQEDSHENNRQEQENELSRAMAWMPLEDIAEQWASFGGAFLTYPALMTTSTVFSALSFESKCPPALSRDVQSAIERC